MSGKREDLAIIPTIISLLCVRGRVVFCVLTTGQMGAPFPCSRFRILRVASPSKLWSIEPIA